ncbi:PREDICTED: hairy/enhancer-of-split related with YRPW motif protein 2 [Ficedula albicollis]|uniref:hairy/enhancer-of-split related with YRPW motif protein 2 n=1 Tax=Ficedula albicollis TaxID=59894 RepID=UPI000359C8C4|nr:PREDICTED: hairy/enhancer-of-split related with YRPW motif protein 2 [Ficedula albicollis]
MYFVRDLEYANTNKRGIIAVLGSRPCKRPLALGAPVEPSGDGAAGDARPAGSDLYISRDLHNSPTHAHVPENTTRGTAREETGAAATARVSGALGRELVRLVYHGLRGARSSQMPGCAAAWESASERVCSAGGAEACCAEPCRARSPPGFIYLCPRAVHTRKRPCEETTSDSDMDETIDVGSENNYSGQSNSSVIRSNSPTTTSQIMARKKRRGIIEKRRRDRINNSLSELRRLVPTAFEKQGSAKLEKAEILQMTVDHLKMLQATGGKGYFDAHSLAMDFMSIGFRECLTEVARYLTSVEGLDTSDPLRVRLVSHLSTCASQREAAAMTSSMAHHHHGLHPPHWAAAFQHLPAALLQPGGLHAAEAGPCRLSSDVPPHGSALLTATFAHADAALRVPSAGSIAPCVPPLSTSLLSLSATVHGAAAVAAATAISPPLAVSAAASPQQAGAGGGTKPYRPWGTEVGAF